MAGDPALPPARFDELAAMEDPRVRMTLSRRDDLSPDQVRTLVGTGDPKVIGPLLSRGRVDPAGLHALAADPSLRYLLVRAEDLPADLLDSLAHDPNVLIVTALAEYRRLPGDLAAELSRHPDRRVRRGLARNTSLPPQLLAEMSADDDVSFALAANPATPAEVVARLATHPSFTVRRAAALRTDLPPETYELLAADPERVVRLPVAANPATPERLLRALAADADPGVAETAAELLS
ncbi:hypothetical protein ACWGE0_37680 [Lentzea sp. NPDC054927]